MQLMPAIYPCPGRRAGASASNGPTRPPPRGFRATKGRTSIGALCPDQFALERAGKDAQSCHPCAAGGRCSPWQRCRRATPALAAGAGGRGLGGAGRRRDLPPLDPKARTTPREVWRDYDAVRRAIRPLRRPFRWMRRRPSWPERVDRRACDRAGRHQRAPLVTGPDASRAVPVHVMARDPALVAPSVRLGFRPGMVPPAGAGGGRRRACLRIDAVRGFSWRPSAGRRRRPRLQSGRRPRRPRGLSPALRRPRRAADS